MPELLRTVTVTIEVETNKAARRVVIDLESDETPEQFADRVKQEVESLMEVA